MLRNREFRLFLLALLVLAAVGIALGFLISAAAGALAIGFSVLFLTATLLFTTWRYRQIARLSDQLRRINSGDHGLDPRDEAEGELSILRSELYKTTVMLREQNAQLHRDKKTLQELLTDISHQLKTPLTSLFVMTDLLCDADLPEDRRVEFTGRIRAQLERLQWLLSALLKLSRLDAGTVQFQRSPIQADVVLQRALAPLLIPMELKGQALHVDADSITVRCDPAWTAEAVLNILKNCVEHTPAGGTLLVSCTENPIYSQIRIQDSGPGISPDDLPHIWSRFYRGSNAHEDSVGVGLALAAAIVQGQGGSVSAQVLPQGGSAFVIRFPKESLNKWGV